MDGREVGAADGWLRRWCCSADLNKAAGKTVTFTSVALEEVCDAEPIAVWVVTDGDAVICAYFAVLPGSMVAPGLWAVNDQSCSP